MNDVVFVGNSSYDFLKINTENYKIFGGSCIYSSAACALNKKLKVGVISASNQELIDSLQKRGIAFLGTKVDKMNEFYIDEQYQTCSGIYIKEKLDYLSLSFETNHLHISIRKGIEFEKIILNKQIKYKTLSVDVMIHSVNDYLDILKKYSKYIDILFCNQKEYNIIKECVENIPILLITNEEKPVMLKLKQQFTYYTVPETSNILSTTGAGDTFIGGFLSSYLSGEKLQTSIYNGIFSSHSVIQKIGMLDNKSFETSNKKYLDQGLFPHNIIVIGNSCAGKSTFVNFLQDYFNIYKDIDDLKPLLEMFRIDDIFKEYGIEGLKKIQNEIVYMKDILEFYIDNSNKVNPYSRKVVNGQGHDIMNPILWDIILQKSIFFEKDSYNIIQFSRGFDRDYIEKISSNVYQRSIEQILNNVDNEKDTIIINVVSQLKNREYRNVERFKNGGHFVSAATMKDVYGKDYFKYNKKDDNTGFISVIDLDIPVYTLNNDKNMTKVELNKFLEYNLFRILEFYSDLRKEEFDGIKKNTKRYLAK